MKVTLVPGFNPGPYTGSGNNTYLIHDRSGRVATLIDAATGKSGHLKTLRKVIGSAQLARVLVTHAHSDHVAGVPAIAAEWPNAEFAKMPWPARDAEYPIVWRSLAEGDEVPAADSALQVLHTPGHAPDHLCFYSEQEDILFSGDLLVRGSTVVIPGSLQGNLAQYLSSLSRIRDLKPARVLPAHGEEITDVVALIDYYIDHRSQRDDEILAVLGAGASTCAEVVDQVYRGLAKELKFAASDSVFAHLIKLEADGRVRRNSDNADHNDGLWERV